MAVCHHITLNVWVEADSEDQIPSGSELANTIEEGLPKDHKDDYKIIAILDPFAPEKKVFFLQDFKFRQRFWTPFEQYRQFIGLKFEPIDVKTLDDDPESINPLFQIELENGETIDAWEEEVVDPKTIEVNGKNPPNDDELC